MIEVNPITGEIEAVSICAVTVKEEKAVKKSFGSSSKSLKKRSVLKVYYDPKLKDWDRQIERAYRKHGLKPGECAVICYPRGC